MVVESGYKIIYRERSGKSISNRPTVPPPFFQERKCKRTHLVVFVVDAVFVLFV